MQIDYSDLLLFPASIEEKIPMFMEQEADYIELLLDGSEWYDLASIYQEKVVSLKNLNVTYAIHPPAWGVNLAIENKELRNAALKQHITALHFAHNIDAHYFVVHPGFYVSPLFHLHTAQELATEAVYTLYKEAKELGIKLVIENVGYNGTSLFTEQEYISFVDQFDPNIIGYVLDTGHAYLNNWNIPNVIEQTSSRLWTMHLNDNHGVEDEHLPIGNGSINWEPIFSALHKQPQLPSYFLLEYGFDVNIKKLREHNQLLLNKIIQAHTSL
ncbi:sugar phosphate isomerase/epimerase family protein [Bacillus bingmayongensis]|uniref:sugar phosphate isomerase/epimerase family protein n=1 Tax=Bacillus bingmayongensis TaxID=1150157 RepID=UPI001C8E2820|nr:sugar phosphate isomerase/epimerase family protein [Bacillus bingmayongensis]MBY0596429.1 sugar phosphate isomerase/epimerase [Bacillus bingmayongensis]